MAIAENGTTGRTLDAVEAADPFLNKKFKPSDLPLTGAQKSAIDSLVHTIKKKGIYDKLRHQIFAQYNESTDKTAFINSLDRFAEAEIERDPSCLSKERRKGAMLLQGAAERSDVYHNVEKSLDGLIAQNLRQIEQTARETRRAEIGDEAAAEEERRGRKTEAEYAHEAAKRQAEKFKVREKEEKRKRTEEEKEKLRLQTVKKMKELERLRQADERRKEKEARKAAALDAKAERDAKVAQMAAEKEAERERERERERDREKEIERERDQERVQIREPESFGATPAARLPTDQELEEAALDRLLREGAELAAKSNKKEPDPLEGSAAPSRPGSISINIPKGPASDRYGHAPKPEHHGPKLSYSSTHRGAPHIPSALSSASRERSRSPYRRQSLQLFPTSAVSHGDQTPHPASARDRTSSAWAEEDPKSAYNSSLRESYDYDEEHEHPSNRRSSTSHEQSQYRKKDRESSGRYDEDGERSGSRYGDRNKPSREYFDEHTGRSRTRIDDPPDNIDRYVPGKGTVTSSRPRDRDRDRDRDRGDRDRDRRSGYGERDRGGERDRDRDRDRRGERGDKEEKGRDEYYRRDRGGDRERKRDKDYERPHRPRRDPVPENIDRYVPGA